VRDIAVFSGSAHPELAAEICAHLGVPLHPVRVQRFANDCLEVQLVSSAFLSSICTHYENSRPISDAMTFPTRPSSHPTSATRRRLPRSLDCWASRTRPKP